MPEQTRWSGSSVGNWLCAALLLVLFAEWLRPLYAIPELTEIYQLAPFVTAIGGFLLLHVLGVPLFASMALHGLIIVGVVAYFFYGMWIWEPAWWGSYLALLHFDIQAMATGRWAALSGENRTVLFLLGWGMILYAVYTIMAVRRQTAWFAIATLAYLFLMQAWAGIDTTWGIVRAAAAGLLLQINLTVSRSIRKQAAAVLADAASPRIELPGRWLAAASLATCMWLAAVLVLSPDKPHTLTELPFPHAAFASSVGSSSPEARTGYKGRSDLLGLPVRPDPSIAFTATTEQPTYWRGDVKYVYTGSGWGDRSDHPEAPGSVNLAVIGNDGGDDQLSAMQNADAPAGMQEQEVWLHDPGLYGEWFSGGPIIRIDETTDEHGEAVDRGARFAHYKIRSVVPPGPGLIGTSADTALPDSRMLVAEDERQAERLEREKQHALQLPPDMPVRVGELAAAIVGEERDPLLAAALVRDYLRKEYAYTMSETTRPAEGADFVDHFLFVQRQGYCDHFSTAMTVMLRTLDIPARWVKGYAPGEITGVEDGKLEITVRQADAHSWVEVWDEQWGWVPYEPTPSYAAELAPEPVDAFGLSSAPASAQVRVSQSGEAAFPTHRHLMMAAGYWFLLAVNAAGRWNWWLLFGLAGISGAGLALLARGASWVRRASERRQQGSGSLMPADSREALLEQWRILERRHGGRLPAETLLEFSLRIPAPSEQERKRWMKLAERLYRLAYQDKSRSSD
ncbi:transglutaminase family protein [Xylanibacillus composti]|uniref:Transglutaminase-like domain-containing protein n=1 Tax=Xylanibacillus composti TaxID=1572762 RepID=A0A8J4M3W5_9BACL|nr:transglutaminaseTgpA domain-containing protein [Xylanibacillus composti]GIQ71280.1 hypothetical protein XYCOK13_41040 [Xylanibacillus composti]